MNRLGERSIINALWPRLTRLAALAGPVLDGETRQTLEAALIGVLYFHRHEFPVPRWLYECPKWVEFATSDSPQNRTLMRNYGLPPNVGNRKAG